MKHLIAAVLIGVFCFSAASSQEKRVIRAGSVYRQNTITIVSPNQADWVLLQSSKVETVFEKRAKEEILTASVKTIKTKSFDNEQEMLASLEEMKKEELLSKYVKDSIHFNYIRFKQTPCVQYDGISNFKEVTTPKFEYFNFKGYLCRHPEIKDSIIQIEFSNQSNLRAFSGEFNSLSSRFFEKTSFSKASVK